MEKEIETLLDQGDVVGAAELGVRHYGPELYGYLTVVLRDEGLAAEAFSQLGEDLWRGLPSFRRESSFRTWAYKLALHAALRIARDPYRKRAAPLETHALSAVVEQVRTQTAAHL